MKLSTALLSCFGSLLALTTSHAYEITALGDISLEDVDTGIGDIRTVFTDEPTAVTVGGVEWNQDDQNVTTVAFETFVDGKSVASGTVDVTDGLPDSIDAGTVVVTERGKTKFRVVITSGESTAETSANYQSFGNGVAIIPLLVVLGLAVSTRMVEFSLISAIFVGACMIEGNIVDGFKETLENYLLNAVADVGHAYVVLFSLFLSGLVGMMEKSGGMLGFTHQVAKYATSSRSGQFCAFAVGCFVFFDDYANVLLAGETMRPLLDSLFVSREKLAFIVDATAAPVASISPVSSWVGFEIGLIETEIQRIIDQEGGEENLRIKTSGMAVFLQSIKYRYYPIFMIVLMVVLIYSKRDFGPMLIAERKTEVYKRTDGGDGKGKGDHAEGTKANQPEEDTPLKSWNMILPVLLLVFFIFYLLVKTGEDPSEDQTLMDKIEASDSYQALLWGTMGAAVCTLLLYSLQIVKDGELVSPLEWPSAIPAMFSASTTDGESKPRLLMDLNENMESFLHGMGRIFPAIIVLNLAWAVGSLMVTVGADRLFARWIAGGISAEALPTLSFLISFFMALATGTSWGTMTILFPMVLLPTYNASGGDPTIFYATTAGILSGSVAGDHVSPISDTTVLSSLACDCNLLSHVSTQMGYAVAVSLVSILLGTIPIGYDAWPNIIGILIGAGLTVLFVYGLCAPVLSASGRYDPMTQLYLMILSARGGENSPLMQLKEDTVKAYNGEYVEGNHEEAGKVLEDDGKLLENSDEDSGAKAVEEGEPVVAEEA